MRCDSGLQIRLWPMYLYWFSLCWFTLCLSVLGVRPAVALNLSDNLRWSIDSAIRHVDRSNDDYVMSALGLDVHKVFSSHTSSKGDFATFIFQPYFVHFSNKAVLPPYFDGKQTELTWRIANLNFHVQGRGAFNVRVGHFEVPFGLEQHIETNGTLHQLSFKERGIKADWGISLNGVINAFEYEIAKSQGVGNDFRRSAHDGIWAGRVGTLRHKNWVLGASFFNGRVLHQDQAIKRWRLGFDMARYIYQWRVLAELSHGADDQQRRQQALFEVAWYSLAERHKLFAQFQQLRQQLSQELRKEHDNQNQTAAKFNLTYLLQFNRRLSMSAQWSQSLDEFKGQKPTEQLQLQVRFRL